MRACHNLLDLRISSDGALLRPRAECSGDNRVQDVGYPPQGVGPVDGVDDEGPDPGVLRAFDVEHGLDSQKFGGYPF